MIFTVPVSSVSANRSSSVRIASWIRARSAAISGYAVPISLTTQSTVFHRKGSVSPSIRPWRIARRMMRRST